MLLLAATALAFHLPLAPAPATRSAVRSGSPAAALLGGLADVEGKTPKTVGDAKIAFQASYGRPVGGLQQGFVNEMLTSVTLAYVQAGYTPSRVFYLGVDSLCTIFLASMSTDAERESLFTSLCAGLSLDPKKLRAEVEKLTAAASGKSEEELLESDDLKLIASAGLKYSYPLGAGLLALMKLIELEPSDEVIERWCSKLGLPSSRLQKDFAFYKDAQEKMVQVQSMMMEMAAAGKRKEAQKLKDAADKAAAEAAEAEAAAAPEEAAA